MNKQKKTRISGHKRIGLAIGLAILLFSSVIVFFSIVFIDEGDRGVVTKFGEIDRTMNPGLNFKIPLIENVLHFSVREQVAAFGNQKTVQDSLDFSNINAKTDGGADMRTDISIGFKLQENDVADMYRNIGTEQSYHEKIVKNQIESTVRGIAANYTIDELHRNEGRKSFQENIKLTLQEEFYPYGLTIERVNMENINFAKAIEKAIDEAEAKSYEIRKQQREVKVEEARAEARRAEARGLRDAEQIATEAFDSTEMYLQYLFIVEAIGNEKATNPIYVPMSETGGLEMFKDIDNVEGYTANIKEDEVEVE